MASQMELDALLWRQSLIDLPLKEASVYYNALRDTLRDRSVPDFSNTWARTLAHTYAHNINNVLSTAIMQHYRPEQLIAAAEGQRRTLMASIDHIQKAEKAEQLARRNDLIDKLTGAWAKRLGEPVDGVEYQNEMRAAWDRNS